MQSLYETAPRLVEPLSDAMAEINATGLTSLLVEQDVTTAFEVAETAFVFATGRTTRTGPKSELVNDPKILTAYLGL